MNPKIEPVNVKPEPPCPVCGSNAVNSPYWAGEYRGCSNCGASWQLGRATVEQRKIIALTAALKDVLSCFDARQATMTITEERYEAWKDALTSSER